MLIPGKRREKCGREALSAATAINDAVCLEARAERVFSYIVRDAAEN